jgi:aspartokinase
MIYLVTRNLAWNNINIVELFSAYSELSIVIDKKDSVKAYEVLQEMMN